ncbi:MAG: hypothetical protein ACOX7J_08835, partial [Bacillota bacterium]
SLTVFEKQLGSWSFLLLALSAAAGLLLCGLYCLWYKVFGNMSMAEIFSRTYGKIGGKVIMTIMIAAFWAVALDLSYTLAYLWGLAVNVKTLNMLLAVLLLISIMAMADKTVICRLAQIVVFTALILLTAGILTIINKGGTDNIFALRLADGWDWLHLGGSGFALTFGLAVFVLPFLKDIVITEGEMDFSDGKRKIRKICFCLIAAVAAGALFLFLAAYCNLAVLGNTLLDYELPFLQLLKQFSLGSSFNQTEIIGVMLFEAIGAVGLAFVFCSLNQLTAETIPVKSRSLLSAAWGILTFAAAFILFPEPDDMLIMLTNCTTYAVWLAAVIIPLLTLLIYKIKKTLNR